MCDWFEDGFHKKNIIKKLYFLAISSRRARYRSSLSLASLSLISSLSTASRCLLSSVSLASRTRLSSCSCLSLCSSFSSIVSLPSLLLLALSQPPSPPSPGLGPPNFSFFFSWLWACWRGGSHSNIRARWSNKGRWKWWRVCPQLPHPWQHTISRMLLWAPHPQCSPVCGHFRSYRNVQNTKSLILITQFK